MLLIIHAARILWREEKRIIVLRFDGGAFTLFGLWRGFKIPCVISLGVSSVSVMVLYISAICSCMVSGAYFVSSTEISSHLRLLFVFFFDYYFSDFICSKGYCHLCWWYGSIDCLFLEKLFLRYSATILLCSVGLAVSSSFSFIKSFWEGFRRLIFLTASYILVLSFCMFSSSRMVFLTFSFSSALMMMRITARILSRYI